MLLKNRILKKIHKDYEGIIIMNMTVRSVLWFKNMNKDIEKFSKVCEICNHIS